jgi:hypothetical protein
VHASQGVVRDFIHIFSQAYRRASEGAGTKIDREAIRAAARTFHDSDKASEIPEAEDRVFQRIVDHVDRHGTTDLFFLSSSVEHHCIIRSLFDQRLIHVVRRNCRVQGHEGRFNEYAIDYGSFVDLIDRGTHARAGRLRAEDRQPQRRAGRTRSAGQRGGDDRGEPAIVIPVEYLELPAPAGRGQDEV